MVQSQVLVLGLGYIAPISIPFIVIVSAIVFRSSDSHLAFCSSESATS